MNTTGFFGRNAELQLLDDLWGSPRATMLILYGRRRVGKTSLLTHWMGPASRRALYWVATPTTTQEQLRSFSQALYNFANPESSAPVSFTYATWEQAWIQAAALTRQERLALFIDEFTYLLQANPSVAGVLQNVWDHHLKNTDIFLALSGSHLGMMQRQVLSYQAPLYGRATAQLHLRPLPFGITRAYFKRYSAAERVVIYAIFGGIPAYWERIDQSISISENILRQLLTPSNMMQEEPRLLLHDFVREPQNYIAILRAVAHNARTQKEILSYTGLPQGHVSKYLSVLQDAGFVERRIPVTKAQTSRLGRYHITDPYLRFYYRFLAERQAQLALGVQRQALEEIKRHLLDFIGTYTWEELSREWLLRASEHDILPFIPDQVGSVWTRKAQVDVVGFNRMEKTIILGECKWSPRAAGRKVLVDLVEKTSNIVPKQGRWRVYYLGFARGGWTEAAKIFAREFPPNGDDVGNWEVVGMKLFDLEKIDTDLGSWTLHS
ncbi:MAG: ATP-binding protein [Chloroflexota bacterium]